MGVLDDAIREHLELKRSHGATDDEIAAKEAEALGPARRGSVVEPEEPLEPGAAAPPDPDAVVAEAPAEPAAEPEPVVEPEPEPVAETEPVPPDEDHAAAPVEPTVDVHAEPEPPAAIEPAAGGPPIHDVDRDPLEPPPPVPGATPGATVEFDALAARDDESARPAGDAPEGDDEDVLEETPEFLRETPEHDRLWFEQRPPRDFDLDN